MNRTLDDTLVGLLRIQLMPIVSFEEIDQCQLWTIHGVEALVRGPIHWPLRSPSALYMAARAAGIELDLDLAALTAAFRHAPHRASGLKLFVNVCLVTLLWDGVWDFLDELCQNVVAEQVVIELADNAVLNQPRLPAIVQKLRCRGFGISVDDVGLVRDNLEHLESLGPINYIKVCQDLLMGLWLEDLASYHTLLKMVGEQATRTGARVIVEGVEQRFRDRLPEFERLGVNLGQGDLFGLPVPPLELPSPSNRASQWRLRQVN